MPKNRRNGWDQMRVDISRLIVHICPARQTPQQRIRLVPVARQDKWVDVVPFRHFAEREQHALRYRVAGFARVFGFSGRSRTGDAARVLGWVLFADAKLGDVEGVEDVEQHFFFFLFFDSIVQNEKNLGLEYGTETMKYNYHTATRAGVLLSSRGDGEW